MVQISEKIFRKISKIETPFIPSSSSGTQSQNEGKDKPNTPLTTLQIMLLGLSNMIGAGAFVLTGVIARHITGPSVVISYAIAGLASLLSGLCYAEMSAKIAKPGSGYSYTYAALGEIWAFLVGWNIILEHVLSTAAVGRAYSGYLNNVVSGNIWNTTGLYTVIDNPLSPISSLDTLALLIVIGTSIFVSCGLPLSTKVNLLLTCLNLCTILMIITYGFYFVNLKNWGNVQSFFPYGFDGTLSGAGSCFFAFVGFDGVTAFAEEISKKSRKVPIAMLSSILIATIIYMLMSSALTLMEPYDLIEPASAFSSAFDHKVGSWARYVVAGGGLCGMTTSIIGSFCAATYMAYHLAQDGLIFSFLGSVNKSTQVPSMAYAAIGLLSLLAALFLDLPQLTQFISLGTLSAYTTLAVGVIIMESPTDELINTECTTQTSQEKHINLCCSAKFATKAAVFVIILCSGILGTLVHVHLGRQKTELQIEVLCVAVLMILILLICSLYICIQSMSSEQEQSFTGIKCPVIPCFSIIINVFLMLHNSLWSWLRFFTWIIIGLFMYLLYGIQHSRRQQKIEERKSLQGSSPEASKDYGTSESDREKKK